MLQSPREDRHRLLVDRKRTDAVDEKVVDVSAMGEKTVGDVKLPEADGRTERGLEAGLRLVDVRDLSGGQ